jgi:hypothetical protein
MWMAEDARPLVRRWNIRACLRSNQVRDIQKSFPWCGSAVEKTERWRSPENAAGRRCVSDMSRRGRGSGAGAKCAKRLLTHLAFPKQYSNRRLSHSITLQSAHFNHLDYRTIGWHVLPALTLTALTRGNVLFDT